MKLQIEHYNHIKEKIDKILAYKPLAEFEQYIISTENYKDLKKRVCFDYLYMAGLSQYICDNVYSYANDNHVYTALKSIIYKNNN